MEKFLLKRRQLLWYLGLGVAGAGGVAALHQARNFRATTESTPIFQVQPSVPPALATENKKMPELQGINSWLNADPLSIAATAAPIASLQGSVVLVQFWTFACINCQRTLPSLVKWHQQYAAVVLS